MSRSTVRSYAGTAQDAERDTQACNEAIRAYADAMAEAGVALSHISDMPTYETACVAYEVACEEYENAMARAHEAEVALWRRFPDREGTPVDRPVQPERPEESDYN